MSGGMKTVLGNESSTTIAGLQNRDYNVGVVANTVGEGPRSVAVTSAAAPSEFRTTVHIVLNNSLLQSKN